MTASVTDGHGPLIVITGPTAVGKSALAVDVAARFGGEIVSADSRQVYRGMEIGTAAPTPEQLSRVPHHLVGYVEPSDRYDVARFQQDVEATLRAIWARGKVAFLVGGTYHYIQAVVERLAIPAVEPRRELRAELEEQARIVGPLALHARLAALDPEAAARILPANLRRTFRALEVIEATGRPFSEQSRQGGAPMAALRLALTLDRETLYRRVDDRIMDMLAAGWLDEVRALLGLGLDLTVPAMTGSGYREMAAHLGGDLTLDEAVRRTQFSTHAFVRRQYAWLRRDPLLIWIGQGPWASETTSALVRDYLEGVKSA